MESTKCKLTVYFDDPFWVGVFERICDDQLFVSKVTFGQEPKDNEIIQFILKNYNGLQFSPAVEVQTKQASKNPKRRLREAKKEVKNNGIGTKSQQALKLQQEQQRISSRLRVRNQSKKDGEYLFALKQQKKKKKHRGH